MVLFTAFEPNLWIVYMRIFEAVNILTALIFMNMKKIRALYRSRMMILTDGV